MEHAQKELLCALLERLLSLGLISNAVYLGAVARVRSAKDLPPFFSPPERPAKGEEQRERT